jgi:hypothetical protein
VDYSPWLLVLKKFIMLLLIGTNINDLIVLLLVLLLQLLLQGAPVQPLALAQAGLQAPGSSSSSSSNSSRRSVITAISRGRSSSWRLTQEWQWHCLTETAFGASVWDGSFWSQIWMSFLELDVAYLSPATQHLLHPFTQS